jgi:hypothetical protein
MFLDDTPENIILRLSHPLHPHDVDAFHRAALDAVQGVEGAGAMYRAIAATWRSFFHPPPDEKGHHHGKYDR